MSFWCYEEEICTIPFRDTRKAVSYLLSKLGGEWRKVDVKWCVISVAVLREAVTAHTRAQ